MSDPLFDPPERVSLDFHLPDAAAARIAELLAADLEKRKGDFTILADILEAVVRYRHLIRSASNGSARLRLTTDEEQVVAHLAALVSSPLRGATYNVADQLRLL